MEQHTKTLGEWYLIMLVEGGRNCFQISNCRFIQAACHSMRLKQVMCHKTVKKLAMEVVDQMIAAYKAEIAAGKAAGVKMSVQVDKWTSNVSRRYMSDGASVMQKPGREIGNISHQLCLGKPIAFVFFNYRIKY